MTNIRAALVVDDKEELAAGVVTMLRQRVFDVRTANNGFYGEAWDFCNSTDPVVRAIHLPERDDVNMMRRIGAVYPNAHAASYMIGAMIW